jgi:hypothetical protein
MRIYNPTNKQVLDRVTLFLTPDEARELGQTASDLAQSPQKHHEHVPDAEFKREITVAVYTPENLTQYDSESRKIIAA